MARFTAVITAAGLVLGACALVGAAPAQAAAGFAAGDVVVYRVGTGSATLSSSAAAVSLDEFSPSGSPVQSVALPTAASGANRALTASGTAGSEGLLSLSADGRYLVATGYSATPGTSGVSSSSSMSVPRTVARVDASDTVNTTTALTDFATGNNPRSATSADGQEFWVAGAAGGVRYAALGATASTQLTANTNFRQVQDVGGQLYVSADTTKNGTSVGTVGNGLPTSGTQPVTNLIPTSSGPQPYGYSLLTLGSGSTPDTLYVGDQGNGVVAKYSLINGTWTAEGSVNLSGVDGLTANDVQGVVTIYATTATGLYSITDSSGAGGTLSGSATLRASAGTNTAFRGVAFAPGTTIGSGGAPPPNPAPTITSTNAGLPAALGDPTVPSTTLTVADSAYTASALTVAATSSDQSVAADSGISITGNGATRTLAVAPSGASGKATITLTVTAPDGQSGTASVTFGVSSDVGQNSARYYSGAGNASAAVDVGNGYAVVADDETDVLHLYDLSKSGPPVKSYDFTSVLPFGSQEIDLEGAARNGNTIYWEGSMSNTSGGNLAPSRSTIFATTVSGSGANTTLTYAGAYTGLRQDLIAWDQSNGNALGLAASAASGVGGHQSNALNLEGVEFAGSSNTLYLAFRAPLEPTTNRHLALLVPLRNVGADLAAGATASGVSAFGAPVELDLGGLGVRDIKENSDGSYLIIAGTADDSNTGFVLYYWDGNPADDPQPTGTTLPQLPSASNAGSWETIVSVPQPLTGGSSVRLLQDDGTVNWYGDGLNTKNGLATDLQKSLGVTFGYTAPTARASSVTLTQDSATSNAGQSVTYTATVAPASGSGSPTGTVGFVDGGSDIDGCTARPVTGGTATCTVTYRTTGRHQIAANYLGDGTFSGSSTTDTRTHTVTGAALDHLTVSPATASTPAGTAVAFTAEGYDQYGNDLGDVTGAASFGIAPGGASTGGACAGASCSATAAGTYSVTATDGPATGSATLTVTAGPLDHLAVSPSSATITAGGSQSFTAEGYDQYGNDLGDDSGPAVFTIRPKAGTGASCSAGTCTATAAGTYTVTATDGAATGTATLTVTPAEADHLVVSPARASVVAGTSQAFTAELYDRYGNDLGDDTSSASFAVDPSGSCTANSCVATAVGSYTVTATDGAATGSAALSVMAGSLDHLVVAPATTTAAAGRSRTFTAEGFDRYGNDLGDDTSGAAFSIDGGGSCSANACASTTAGRYTVTATDGSGTGTAELDVVAGPVDSLTLAPGNATVAAGTAQTYTAEGADRYGNDTGDETAAATFTIMAGSGGSATGATCSGASCSATDAGDYVVSATVPSGSASAAGTTALTVTAGPLATLTLSPANAAVVTGGSQDYTASGADSYGNSRGDLTSRTTFTITGNGSCSANTCTAPDAGTFTVTGRVGSVSGTSCLTATAPQPPAPAVTSVSASGGPITGGTTVTITGTALGGASGVTFGGTAATTVTVLSNTKITAVAPAHRAGGVDVQVTTDAGTSASSTADRYVYAVPPRPSVTSLSPRTGPATGGTTVTVYGKNLTGATAVSFGATSTSSVTVVSATQLSVVSPAQAAGVVDVTVTTPSGTSSAASADRFTYAPVAPAVSSVSPASGTTHGGTTVTVSGARLTGATEVDFGSTAVTDVTVVSDTQLTVVSPAHAAGAVAITVVTPAGTSPASSVSFTFVAPRPTVTGVSPGRGSTNGGTTVTIAGTGFSGATRVAFGQVAATSFTVVSDTKITATAPAQGTGAKNIFVTASGGVSQAVTADQFTYVVTTPAASAVAPKSGPVAGGTTVTITGTRFTGTTGVSFGGAAAASFTVVSDSKITAVTPRGVAGQVGVTVTTSEGISPAAGGAVFTYS